MSEIIKIDTISQGHELLGLPKPKHPLVSVFRHSEVCFSEAMGDQRFAIGLYQVMLKKCAAGSLAYGRNSYDFQEGTLIFTSPGQVIGPGEEPITDPADGWTLAFHPDLIRKSELGRMIDSYSFFLYDNNEALHLSDDEKKTITDLIVKIDQEYNQNIDQHSQRLIISNIQLLLDYCTRFYDRQFFTRTNLNKDVVSKFEHVLANYFESELLRESGLPTVKYCADNLNLSPNYLSDMLKKETGKNTQEHIHFHIIEKAKTILLNSTETVSEIAYDLGFEYPQYFSKLFKSKTGFSPAEFRNVN